MAEPYALDLSTVRAFLDRSAITYLVNDELKQFAIPRPDREGWALRIVMREERGMLTVAYPLPGAIPDERLDALAASANLLNARTFMGAWILNMSAKELYFRVTLPTDHVQYDDTSLRFVMQLVIGTVDRVLPRLDAVLKGADPSVVLDGPDAPKE